MNNYNKTVEEIYAELETDEQGLTEKKVSERLEKNGYNKLLANKKKSLFARFIDQLKDVMIIVLICAAVLSLIISILEGESFSDTIIILFVVLLNSILGVAQEVKADNAIEALQNMSVPYIKVRRNNKITSIKSEELVIGDIILIESGDYIPADVRIIESHSFKVVESALTGEAESVEKFSKVIDDMEVPLAERYNISYSGSHAVYGRAEAVVIATGMNTELGKIASVINDMKEELTPLQKKMNELSKILSVLVLFVALIMFIIGLLQGSELIDVFMLAVALAVAAIPEGLAAVITVSLAIGVQKMSKQNSIIRKLSSVEALGSTEVICSDKTGTLTQNKMTVRKIYMNNEILDYTNTISLNDLGIMNNAMILCNDSKINGDIILGDPTETSLINFAKKLKLNINNIIKENERIEELPFDSNRKMMSTINSNNNEVTMYTKGSVEAILNSCSKILINGKEKVLSSEEKNKILETNEKLSNEALRVLGFAYKFTNKKANYDENHLVFIGLAAMIDPPRVEVKDAVSKCFKAGMVPIMITGDNINTAIAIAKEVGIYSNNYLAITGLELDKLNDEELLDKIEDIRIYARVSPENKIRIVDAWQSKGKIVAMTGDGVNDAPALKGADIGIGMGISGTEVSKNVSSMVLADDNFATIVTAVEEGRRIYTNIQNAIVYLLASNLTEIIIIFFGIIIAPNETHILIPAQILWINLISDTIPALALAFENAESDIMTKKPRNQKEPFFNKFTTSRIITAAFIKSLILCSIYLFVNSQFSHDMACSVIFILLAAIEILFAFSCRSSNKSILEIGFFSNSKMTFCIIGTLFLQIFVLTNEYTSSWLGVNKISPDLYSLIIITIIGTFLMLEIAKVFIAMLFNKNND